MECRHDESADDALFLNRQPIFDRDQHLWGYGLAAHANDFDPDDQERLSAAFAWLATDGISQALQGVPVDRKIMVNVPLGKVDIAAAKLLPKERCIIRVVPVTSPDPGFLDDCRQLKETGYTLAMSHDMFTSEYVSILSLAEIMILDVSGLPPLDIARLRKTFKKFPWSLMVENLGDWESFEGTRYLGFSFFHGPFFGKPRIAADKQAGPSALAGLQLLRALNAPNCDIQELGEIISRDPSLSFRLLRYINSPAFCLKQKVQSMAHAISLLGLKAFKQWTHVVFMAGMDPSGKGEELAYRSLARAKFLEQASMAEPNPAYSGETMFMVGMFSLLDAMLDREMAEIVADMPLAGDIKAALCGEQNAVGRWLELVRAVENGDWAVAREVVAACNIPAVTAATTYMKAASWARESILAAR